LLRHAPGIAVFTDDGDPLARKTQGQQGGTELVDFAPEIRIGSHRQRLVDLVPEPERWPVGIEGAALRNHFTKSGKRPGLEIGLAMENLHAILNSAGPWTGDPWPAFGMPSIIIQIPSLCRVSGV